MLADLWLNFPAAVQDAVILLALLLGPALLGLGLVYRLRPWLLLRALLRRNIWTNLTFVVLVAISVALGVGVIVVERGLRSASARVADKFDLIVAAPGDQVSVTLQSVFLQQGDAALLDGAAYASIVASDRVALAAPLAFGDSAHNAPIVGTTWEFVAHLIGQGGALEQGRPWRAAQEAVIGAKVDLKIGAHVTPSHGRISFSGATPHHGTDIEIVGRMPMTGSPWDAAILVPVESVWRTHGLSDGHAPGTGMLGAPFDPAYFPGTPAVIIKPDGLSAAYGLQRKFDARDGMMAFFPGAVMARLYGVLGDIRMAMSVLALVSQALVVIAVFAGLIVLIRLFARHVAVLRALGAPARLILALLWGYAASLLWIGGGLGIAFGWLAVKGISMLVAARSDLVIAVSIGWGELHIVAAFLALGSLAALFPAGAALARPIAEDLRR